MLISTEQAKRIACGIIWEIERFIQENAEEYEQFLKEEEDAEEEKKQIQ